MDAHTDGSWVASPRNTRAPAVSLDGTWELALGAGTSARAVAVPGAWEAQGFSKHVDGPARYRRATPLPARRPGERLYLELDAVSHACEVRVNGKAAGSHVGSWTPFAFDVTDVALAGENVVEIEVWKPGTRYPVRQSLAGFLPDVATTFGGLWQSCRIRAVADGFLEPRVDCDPASGEVRVRARAVSFGASPTGEVTLEVFRDGASGARTVGRIGPDRSIDLTARVPDRALWEPGAPVLYDARLTWSRGGGAVATWERRVGFRTLATDGDRLLLNGRPVLVRGALSWGYDPAVIAPIYAPEVVRRELRGLRDLGFNCVKLCLFIPNQSYFDVADEEGMLLWEELPLWLPEVTPELARRAPGEYAEYMPLVRDHPSVVLCTLGCELGAGVTPELLGALDRAARTSLSGVLVCDNSGSGESYGGYDFDLADFTDYHPYYDLHWFEPLLDNWRRDWRDRRPWIFGEFCDQDGFRDLAELVVANAGVLPWWMTEDLPIASWRPEARAIVEAEPRLRAADPGFAVAEMVRVASAQALVTRKYTVESLRRREGMGGYVITGLRDTPIATSGVFDDLGRPKWTADEVRAFNDEAVLCLEVPRRRKWTHGGDRPSRIDPHCHRSGARASWSVVLHATYPVSARSSLTWKLRRRGGAEVAAGHATLAADVAAGVPRLVGTIDCALPEVVRAEELELTVRLETGTARVENRWPLWVYPAARGSQADVLVYDPSHSIDEAAEEMKLGGRVASAGEAPARSILLCTAWDDGVTAFVGAGGRALLWQQGMGPLPAVRGPFWREGVKLFAPHPTWDAFPHRGFADLQFFGLATDLMLDGRRVGEALGGGARVVPVLRRLDARTFAMHEYILEARVGAGVMLATTLRLAGGQGAQPAGMERNVAGRALFDAMVECLSGA